MADELLPPVEARLTANTSEFRDELDRAAGDMEKTERRGSEAFGKLAKGIGLGLVAVGGGVAAFAASSVAKFGEVGGAIDGLQDVTGESAETMSRLRYAFTSWGVSGEALEKGMLKLSKAVGNGNAAFEQYGIATKDAQGNTLPMSEIMANAADVFASMPDGIEKSNLAMQLFGKSGTDLIDVMNGGRSGLEALGDEAERFGLVMGEEDVAAAEKNAKSKRQLSAAWEGLQLQLGKVLMPILATASGWLADKIPAGIALAQRAFSAIRPTIQTIADALSRALPVAISIAVGAWDAITSAFTWLTDHRPILIGVITAIGVGLGALFVMWAAGALSAAVATIAATWPILAIGAAIAGLVAGVIYAYEHWGWFRTAVDAVASFFTDTLWPVLQNVFGWLRDNVPPILSGIVDWFRRMWERTETLRVVLAGAFKNALDTARSAIDLVWGAVRTVADWIQTAWDRTDRLRSLLAGGFKLAWDAAKGAIDLVKTAVETVVGWIDDAWTATDKLRGLLVGAFKAALDTAKSGVDTLGSAFGSLGGLFRGAINTLIDAWNRLDFKIDISVPDWVPGVGGKGFKVNDIFPDIPRLAVGGTVMEAGLALVGEKGPEIVELPRGATVHPHGTGPGSGSGIHLEQHFHGITDHRQLAIASSAELAWLMKTRAA